MKAKIGQFQVYALYILCLLSAVWGMFCLHGGMFDDGFGYVHGDLGDGRLNSLFLEHGYQYLFGDAWFKDFWAPRWLYYPFPRSMALSDVMIGSVPLYAPWRWLGFDPIESYQLWFLSVSVCNYCVSFITARMLKINILGAAACAFLFSFSLPITGFSNHPQLMPRFPCILSLAFLIGAYRSEKPLIKTLCAFMSGICFAWQFWISFYPAWYYMFILSVFGIVALIFEARWLARTLLSHKFYILFALGTSLLLLYPIATQYLTIQAMVGPRDWEEIKVYLPDIGGYLSAFAYSPYYRLLANYNLHTTSGYAEKLMFAGFVPFVAFLVLIPAIWKRSSNSDAMRFALVCTAAMIVLLLLPIRWPNDITNSFSPWLYVYKYYPAAGAIRVTGRIIVMTMFFWGLVLGILINYLFEFKNIFAVLARWGLFAGILIESYVPLNQSRFSKIENYQRINAIIDKITALQSEGKVCHVFHNRVLNGAPHEVDIDAMWVSVLTKIPTTNGYSGMPPPYYKELNLDKMEVSSIGLLSAWLKSQGVVIPEDKICILQ